MTLTAGPLHGTLNNADQASCIAKVLSASQKYMRDQKVRYQCVLVCSSKVSFEMIDRIQTSLSVIA